MNIVKCYIKKMILIFYNKRHDTRIRSIHANLKATYGIDVLVSRGTTISDDVSIGDYSYVNTNSYIENCLIGKFCSISSGVYISPTEHDYTMRTTHPITRDEKAELLRPKVVIGNDVLISLNSIILEGVTIGDGAVIGAGAVVTKDVKPYEIVGGVPARHIKFRFSEDEISSLEAVKWWNWDIDKIKNNMEYLRNQSNNIKD